MTIALGCDHNGVALVDAFVERLSARGITTLRFGATSPEAYDYPLASDGVACAVKGGEADFGVLVCGSGIGVSIRANRHKGVRAASCTSKELALAARSHNHANVLCLGASYVDRQDALDILDAFLEGKEDHAERHDRRVALFDRNTDCPDTVEKGSGL